MLDALKHKVAEIEDMQKRLKANRAKLLAAIKNIEERPAELDCADGAQWVMDRLRAKGAIVKDKRRRPSTK